MEKNQKNPEEKKEISLFDLLLKDTGVNVQVISEQLKIAKKFKGSISRLMLVADKKLLQNTLVEYFNLTDNILSNMLVNLNNQEKAIQKHKDAFEKMQNANHN